MFELFVSGPFEIAFFARLFLLLRTSLLPSPQFWQMPLIMMAALMLNRLTEVLLLKTTQFYSEKIPLVCELLSLPRSLARSLTHSLGDRIKANWKMFVARIRVLKLRRVLPPAAQLGFPSFFLERVFCFRRKTQQEIAVLNLSESFQRW